MNKIIFLILLLAPVDAQAMCVCKAVCKKDIVVTEHKTKEEALTEYLKHKTAAMQEYNGVYQVLVWDEALICETNWPETCQCEDEKH